MEREEEIKLIEKAIQKLEKRKLELKREMDEVKNREWKNRKDKGWRPFIFFSSYYGSECHVGDSKIFYVFSPMAADKINIEKWAKAHFAHGDRTQESDNEEFEKAIDELAFEDYDYLDDNTIQAVWPELYEVWKKL